MRILVVSPHPDDETLGAGGYILKMIAQKNEVFWLNATTMINSEKFSIAVKKHRDMQLKAIEDFYGFHGVYHLSLPTMELEEINSSEAIDKIAKVLQEVEPEVLILPDYNDAHSDHRKVFDWCFSCSKIFRFPYIKKIMTMEITSETDFGRPEMPFVPNYYIDISEHIDDKIKAMNIYDTEIGEPPFPRSEENIRAIATVRGAEAGVRYAEAFRIIKYID